MLPPDVDTRLVPRFGMRRTDGCAEAIRRGPSKMDSSIRGAVLAEQSRHGRSSLAVTRIASAVRSPFTWRWAPPHSNAPAASGAAIVDTVCATFGTPSVSRASMAASTELRSAVIFRGLLRRLPSRESGWPSRRHVRHRFCEALSPETTGSVVAGTTVTGSRCRPHDLLIRWSRPPSRRRIW